MLSLAQFASYLPNGKVVAGGVSFAGIGHSGKDTSGRLLLNPAARNGYCAESFAGDDPLQLRDFIDARCGLPRFQPGTSRCEEGDRQDPRILAHQQQAREQHRVAREAEAAIKADRVRRIWDEADPDPFGKLPNRYLVEHRNLDLLPAVCGHAIRWHSRCPWEGERVPVLLSAFRDNITNSIVGLHRIRLDPQTGAKIDRKMLGRAKGASIKLSRDSEVATGLVLAEGVETGIAGMMLGLQPMWVTGSVGGIGAFPVLSGIETLTICAETGDGGASAAAIERVGNRWAEAGREVLIVAPKVSGDLNDAIREVRR